MDDQQPTASQQTVALRLASSNSNPVRHIPPTTCETIRRLIRARQEVFELIEQLEGEVRMSFDDFRILETLDLDYNSTDWAADKEVTQDDARAFLKKAHGEVALDADKLPDNNLPDGVIDLRGWQVERLIPTP